MSIPRWEITKKAETSYAVYWGVGPTVTVLDAPGQSPEKRFVCLTCRGNACDHVTAMKRYLHLGQQEAA